MIPYYILMVLCLLVAGCQGTGPAKIDNPVVGPPPPRLPPEKIRQNQLAAGMRSPATRFADNSDSEVATARAQLDGSDDSEAGYAARSIDDVPSSPGGIQRVSLETTKDQDLPPFDDAMIVAMVNETPVFAGEVLAPMRRQVKEVERQIRAEYGKEFKPEMLHRVRAMFIRGGLPRIIERKLLVQAAKSTFKKQQIEGLTKAIDEEWKGHIQRMLTENKVNTVQELDQLLKENDFEMSENEAAFREQQMAMNFVSFKAHSKFEPTRKEVLAYYEEHKSEYEFPARVHWQQLVISNSAHGGEAGARKVTQKVVQELLDGADFGATVKKYGDGPKAAQGGIWDWTVKGSLANKEIENELFTLPIGEMSGVVKTPSGFQIVQVIDRQEAGCRPFDSLQAEIEGKLKEEAYKEKAIKVMEEIRANAIITTVFDSDTTEESRG